MCIPAYQAERYLGEALDSVLAEVPHDAEVIVVDDGSTDTTHAVAASYGERVRIIRQTHAGIGAAFNAAVAASSGDLVAAIDADDLWLAGKTQAQFRELQANPALAVVFGHAYEFVSPEAPRALRERFAPRTAPVPGIMRGTMMIRRPEWNRVGGMRTDLRAGEFVAWYARALDTGLHMKVLPRVVLARRIHGHNTVLRVPDLQHDYLRIVRARIEQRRTTGAR